MYGEKLSGKVRHRIGFRGVLILQVEYARPNGPDDWQGMPTYLSASGLWRDATVEDMNELGRITSELSHNAALRGDSGLIAGVPLESTVMQQEDK